MQTLSAAGDSPSSRLARFRVDEPFGGLTQGMREIDIHTGLGNGDCGVEFETGEVYLIDAYVDKDGTASTGICSFTRRLDSAGVLLWLLRQRRDGKPVPSLVGRAARIDRSFDGTIETLPPRPLANLLVRVKAGRRQYQTQADADGLYAFYNLPSGKYEFIPDLPPGMSISWYIGSDDPPAAVEIKEGACRLDNIDVFPSGSIEGRILDASGEPRKSAFAYIVPAGKNVLPKQSKLYWEYQGRHDYFKFVHIPPGQYLIVVNPDDSLDPDFPYGRTFFPGVHDQASAATITIQGGEQIKNVDIRLKQQFAPRHVRARVTWSDGRPMGDFIIVTAKGTVHPNVLSDAKQLDLKASVFELNLLPNETYKVEAELTCRYSEGRILSEPGATLKSNEVYLEPTDGRKEVLLTIPVTSCPELPGKTLLNGH